VATQNPSRRRSPKTSDGISWSGPTRANAGGVEGVVALYEPGAVLAFPAGRLTAGQDEIRKVCTELLAGKPSFSSAGQSPAIRNGDLALTSTRLPGGGATVEVARRQPDGSWRWVIDQPAVLP